MMMGGIEGRSVATGNDLQSNPHNDKKPNAEDGLATSANVIACNKRMTKVFPYDSLQSNLSPTRQHSACNGIKRSNSQISSAALHLDGNGGEISHSSDIRFRS